ncbi:hypothetical protein [Methylocella sp.]|uniref:hypothetical protein n=1 Tax=Methylocella sp. TaxID=1978226 RepID=UPI00378420AE
MDLYSKIVFTVIALALSAIALQNAGVPVLAQGAGPQLVRICGFVGDNERFGGHCAAVDKGGVLTVRLAKDYE